MAMLRTPTNLTDLARHIFPQIHAIGACYGYSYMVVPSLIFSNLSALVERLDEIYYEKELPVAIVETKSEIKKSEQDASIAACPKADAFEELKKQVSNEPINLPDLKTFVTKPPVDSLGEFRDLPIRTPQSLQNYLQRAEEVNSQSRESKIPESFPRAKDIETFFSGIALNQATNYFRFLFDDENVPAEQDAEKAAAIIGNYESISEIDRMTHLYSFPMMQQFFDSLARALSGHNLPFAMIMYVHRHMFVIGMMNEKFILINIADPYPRAIAQRDIALEVFKACTTSILPINSLKFNVTFGFDEANKKLFYMSCEQDQSINLDTVDLTEWDKTLLACATTNKIKKLTDMNFIIHWKWYTHTNTLKQMQEIYRDWQESAEFKSIYQIPSSFLTEREDHPDPTSVFHMACFSGDLKKIKQLIELGFNINQIGPRTKYTPLSVVCEKGDVKGVALLLEHKADPNVVSANGGTPLFIAIEHGFISIVRMLLRAGADVNATVFCDQTPLATAVYRGFAKITDLLLQSGAQIDSSRKLLQDQTIGPGYYEPVVTQAHQNGTLHLLLAAQRGHSDVVDVLIEHGADVNLALFLAVKFNLINATGMLLLEKKADPNFRLSVGEELLFVAIVDSACPGIVKLLLNAGADVNLPGPKLMVWAVKRRNAAVVKFLVETRQLRDIDAVDKYYDNALLQAACEGDKPIFDLLLEAKANPNFKQPKESLEGLSILHMATLGSAEIVDDLLTRKVRHDVVNHKGQTPLEYASKPNALTVFFKHGICGDLLDHLDIKKSILYQRCESWQHDKKQFFEEYHAAYIRQLSAGTSKLRFFTQAKEDCMLEFDGPFFQCTKA